MAYSWSDNSRYGAPRHYEFNGEDRITVTCKDVLYTSYSNKAGDLAVLQSVDPDGGPYLCIGGIIGDMNHTFKVLEIVSNVMKRRTLLVVLRMEKK